MRPNSFFIPAFCGLLFIQLFAVYNNIFWLEDLTEWLFLPLALFRYMGVCKNLGKYLCIFLIFYTLAYFFRIGHFEFHNTEISLVFATVAISGLTLEASKYITMKKFSTLMLIIFLLIVGVNGFLLTLHLLKMKTGLSDNIFFFYSIYYFNLLVLGICAFLYYVNSYSSKSVYFSVMVLAIIFAAILRDMGYFYLRDVSVEMAEGILRAAFAVFVVIFFKTPEKNMVLLSPI